MTLDIPSDETPQPSHPSARRTSRTPATVSRLGMQSGALYFRGRVGPLGAVSATAATAVIGIFPARVVDLTWQRSADLPVAVALDAYLAAGAAWGEEYLGGIERADRLATLAETVIDEADGSALPLFAAWKAQPRPAAGPARLRRTAWRDDEILALQAYAAATSDLELRWAAAEDDTTAAFARHLAVLSASDLAALEELLRTAETESR